MNDTIFQDSSPEQIALALDANRCAFCALLSTLSRATLYDEPGLLWVETGIAHDVFNGVFQTRLSRSLLPTAIERVLADFRQRRLPFQWRIGAGSQVVPFGDLLEASGIEHIEDEPGMAVDLLARPPDLPPVPHLVIQPVISERDLQQWSRTTYCGAPEEAIEHIFTAYAGLPREQKSPLRLYLGVLDGTPVATVELFYAAGVAYIGGVVTVHAFRQRGIGAMMTLHAMQESRRVGYRIGVLTASPMGVNIYRRLGFKECCQVSTYAWSPSPPGE